MSSRIQPDELRLFDELGDAPVCIDGGGGHGEWTEALLEARPRAQVYVFEPHPDSFRRLKERGFPKDQVFLYQIGLSDRYGVKDFWEDGDGLNFGSSLVRRGHHVGKSFTVRTMDLGCFAPVPVELLKLDIEGEELLALGGLGELRPRIIQFEYGGTWVDAGLDIADAYRLLEAMGYILSPMPELGVYTNVVARLRTSS